MCDDRERTERFSPFLVGIENWFGIDEWISYIHLSKVIEISFLKTRPVVYTFTHSKALPPISQPASYVNRKLKKIINKNKQKNYIIFIYNYY
jgi:hypothetical protein